MIQVTRQTKEKKNVRQTHQVERSPTDAAA